MDATEHDYWQRIHGDYVEQMRELDRERLVVSAVIVAQGRVLLVRRAPNDTYPGMWEYPGGGVDQEEYDFEHIVTALRREVFEETRVEVPEHPSGEVLVHPTRTALRIVLRFDLEEIPEVTLSHEHDAAQFCNLEQAKTTRVDGDIIFSRMREENQDVLSIVCPDTMGLGR